MVLIMKKSHLIHQGRSWFESHSAQGQVNTEIGLGGVVGGTCVYATTK